MQAQFRTHAGVVGGEPSAAARFHSPPTHRHGRRPARTEVGPTLAVALGRIFRGLARGWRAALAPGNLR